MLELLLGAAILALALFTHAASLCGEHRSSESGRARSSALIAAEGLIERLRADADFGTLYDRLAVLSELSRRPRADARAWLQRLAETRASRHPQPGPSEDCAAWCHGDDLGLASEAFRSTETDAVVLRDGRRAFPPSVFFADHVAPSQMRDLHLAVAVPVVLDAEDVPSLREDLHAPRLGLPADLDGDGRIDAERHEQDYAAIPIVLTLRWTTSAGAAEETSLTTWLWGYRR